MSHFSMLVYVGHSCIGGPIPSWPSTLVAQDGLVFTPYFSGGKLSDDLLSLLRSKASETAQAHKLCMKLAQGYTSRLIDSLLSPDIDRISSLVSANPYSVEYRILLDLWILSRSDVYVVDCDQLGFGRLGLEASYAQGILRTVGVHDGSYLDPWYHYHLDVVVKSRKLLEYLVSTQHHLCSQKSSDMTSSAA